MCTFGFLQILKCISHLELAQLIGTGIKPHAHGGKSRDKKNPSHNPIESYDAEGWSQGYDYILLIGQLAA